MDDISEEPDPDQPSFYSTVLHLDARWNHACSRPSRTNCWLSQPLPDLLVFSPYQACNFAVVFMVGFPRPGTTNDRLSSNSSSAWRFCAQKHHRTSGRLYRRVDTPAVREYLKSISFNWTSMDYLNVHRLIV